MGRGSGSGVVSEARKFEEEKARQVAAELAAEEDARKKAEGIAKEKRKAEEEQARREFEKQNEANKPEELEIRKQVAEENAERQKEIDALNTVTKMKEKKAQ